MISTQPFLLIWLLLCRFAWSADSRNDSELAKCYHRVLGVKPSATDENDLKVAYLKRKKSIPKGKASGQAQLLKNAYVFMKSSSNRRRLRKFLKRTRACGWRYDWPTVGTAVNRLKGCAPWITVKRLGDAYFGTAAELIDDASAVYQERTSLYARKTTNKLPIIKKATNLVYLYNSGSMRGNQSSPVLDVAHHFYQ